MRKKTRYPLIIGLFVVLLLAVAPSQPAYARTGLNKTSIVLRKGKTKKLKVRGAGSKVVWSSTNPKVAGVSQTGKVTGVNGGNATIKAKTGGKTLRCKVKVVALNYTSYTLKSPGSTKKLKVTNGKKTRWKSSNKKVVTVSDDGKITAVGSGTARITCRTRGFRLTCKVYVPDVNHTSVRMKTGESFGYKVSKTRQKASYYSSDTTVLAVDTKTGLCKAMGHGAAYACAKADGYVFRCYVMVEKEGDIVTPRSKIPGSTKGETYRQEINTGKGYRTYTVFHQTSANGFKTKTISQIIPDSSVPTTEESTTETEATTQTGPATETGSSTEPAEGEDPEDPADPGQPEDPEDPEEPVVPVPEVKKYKVKNFISNHGCAACATTTVLSGYLSEKQTPVNTVKNLEMDALGFKNWDKNYSKSEKYQMPIALYGIRKVLEKNGIPCRYVRTYSRPSVLTQIRDHLLKGKPVVITVGATRYDGKKDSRWTGGRHTMVLLGMTDRYKVIVGDSADRADTFGNMRRIKVVDLSDVCGYLFKTTKKSGSNLTYPYYTNYKYCGGYILVDVD